MKTIALATTPEADGLDPDAPLIAAALARAGVQARFVDWESDTDWSSFDLVVVWSTWNYASHLERFLEWAESVPNLLNPAAILRWNTDKRYLLDLDRAGVPIVRSEFVAPGEPLELPDTEFVVKPAVGAGSVDARRFLAGDRDAIAHVERLHARGAVALVQPYLDSVDRRGETATVFFDGVFDHAARKGPLLQLGAGDVGELFLQEEMTERIATGLEREVAQAALAVVPGPLLYGRVDLLEGPDGPVVLELELTEPSLFLPQSPGSADRLAAAMVARM